jgi:hypothetical protein
MGAFWHLKHTRIRTYQNNHISPTSQQECHEFKLNLKLTNMTDDFQNFPHSLQENTMPITVSSPTHCIPDPSFTIVLPFLILKYTRLDTDKCQTGWIKTNSFNREYTLTQNIYNKKDFQSTFSLPSPPL